MKQVQEYQKRSNTCRGWIVTCQTGKKKFDTKGHLLQNTPNTSRGKMLLSYWLCAYIIGFTQCSYIERLCVRAGKVVAMSKGCQYL